MTIERKALSRNYTLPENSSALLNGLRYSPEAIRQLAWKFISENRITSESIGLNPHPNPLVLNDLSFQRDYSIACYLHLTGFIGEEEFYKMASYVGSKNSDIVETKWDSTDLFVTEDTGFTFGNTPSPIRVRNVIKPSFQEVAEDVNFIRSKKDVVVVLAHGKWNGFPHTGYFQMYREVMTTLRDYGIKEEKIVFVLAGDTNKDIKNLGFSPFLNTLWRLSMNSYIPYDFLCSSGDFESIDDASDHWIDNYMHLQPDFIHFDSKDPLISHKIKRIKKLKPKITPIIRGRFSEGDSWFVSQTNLRTFGAGIFTVKYQFEDALANQHYFNRKANWKKFLQENGRLF